MRPDKNSTPLIHAGRPFCIGPIGKTLAADGLVLCAGRMEIWLLPEPGADRMGYVCRQRHRGETRVFALEMSKPASEWRPISSRPAGLFPTSAGPAPCPAVRRTRETSLRADDRDGVFRGIRKRGCRRVV